MFYMPLVLSVYSVSICHLHNGLGLHHRLITNIFYFFLYFVTYFYFVIVIYLCKDLVSADMEFDS